MISWLKRQTAKYIPNGLVQSIPFDISFHLEICLAYVIRNDHEQEKGLEWNETHQTVLWFH
jgi:hypothetical protein